MGTWDLGPFDNDAAADWSNQLDDIDPEERIAMIVRTLSDAADESDYLDAEVAAQAIAAAAVVAAHQPNGPAIDSPYAPEFLIAGEPLEIPPLVPALALRALDRIEADESEWRSLWEEAGSLTLAIQALAPIRTALAPDSSSI